MCLKIWLKQIILILLNERIDMQHSVNSDAHFLSTYKGNSPCTGNVLQDADEHFLSADGFLTFSVPFCREN
jgi:hypothetical protein